jgi:glycosidase
LRFLDGGYDISDFKKVNPMFGTNADLEELFREARKIGLKIILDFVSSRISFKFCDKCETPLRDPQSVEIA